MAAPDASEQLTHPIPVGSHVTVQRGDGQLHTCEVIERLCEDNLEWKYYVHYEGLNRRLDEWVASYRVQLEADDALGGSRKGACVTPDREFGHRRATRNMKRKIDEINHVQTSAAHDEALEKEHEESTKLKNVQSIEMGRYLHSLPNRPHVIDFREPCQPPRVGLKSTPGTSRHTLTHLPNSRSSIYASTH